MIRSDDHNQVQHYEIVHIADQNRNDQQSQRMLDALYHCYELEQDLEVVVVVVEEEEEAVDRYD